MQSSVTPAVPLPAAGTNALDEKVFPLGIVRLGLDRRVTYVNDAAMKVSGNELKAGMDITDLPMDDESRGKMKRALQQRFEEGRAQSYGIRFKRRDLGTYVRILNSAVPEYDAAGVCIGSIGYISDESMDFATVAIHKVIANAKECRELLSNLTRELREVLSFDSLTVTGISQQRQHLSRIFEEPLPPPEITPTMWWPMPEFVKALIADCEVDLLDLQDLFATKEWKEYEEREPAAKQFRERGFEHCLRIGVYRAEKLVALVSMMRGGECPRFTEEDIRRCRKLPIVEAVIAAMNFEQQRNLEFGSDFVQAISQVANDHEAIGQVVVNQLACHYGWNHVSLFRLDRDGRRFSMVCQSSRGKTRIPDGYSQDAATGLLGTAFRERRAANVGDVTHAQWASECQPLLPDTRSELVFPVPGTECHWLLNVESELRDAFADEEQSAVEVPLRIAGFILERVASLDMKTAILKSVADAVIQTNDSNLIIDANPAAEKLLGWQAGELLNRDLADLIALDPHAALAPTPAAALDVIAERAGSLSVKLKCRTGLSIPVLLSAAPLPQRMGGKVFVATDLREQNRIQRMEVLNNVFHQLASEIRMPLALSETFLTEALEHTSGESHELVDKTLRQIHKADMPLERMVRLAVSDQNEPLPRTTFDLRAAIDSLIAEFPASNADDIVLTAREQTMSVQAPRHELLFCVRSLVTYLMRRKAQVEKVQIVLERRDGEAVMSVGLPQDASEQVRAAELAGTESDFELTLAEPVLLNLMQRMGGEYSALGKSHRGFQLHFGTE